MDADVDIQPGNQANLTIRGEGLHRYTYAQVYVITGVALGAFFSWPLASSTQTPWWLILFGAPLVMGLESGAFCLFWIRRELRVSYVVEDDELRALRGDKIVRSIPVADIRTAKFEGRMRLLSIFTRYLPSWPRLEITYERNGKVIQRGFPAIMLWDAEQDRAQQALRDCLGFHKVPLPK